MASSPLEKPLPHPPTAQISNAGSTSCLSADSGAHLRLFISRALAEEKVDEAQEWIKGIEVALRELCDSILQGKWLSDFKTARKSAEDRRVAATVSRRQKKTVNSIGTDIIDEQDQNEEDDNSGPKESKGPDPVDKRRNTGERRQLAVEQINNIMTASSTLSTRTQASSAHLLLTASQKSVVLPTYGMHSTPSKKICEFSSGRFAFPSIEDWKRGTGGVILYGLDDLDVDATVPTKFIGGTFSFAGISSTSQFHTLSKVLRLSIYVCLSLLLEQCVLLDSHVHLDFPVVSPAQSFQHSYTAPDLEQRQEKHSSKSAGSGLWSLFAKRTESLLHRTINVDSLPIPRVKSLEASSVLPNRSRLTVHPSAPHHQSRRTSFSQIPGPAQEEQHKRIGTMPIFTDTLNRIIASLSILSSSPGIVFSPPHILTFLAEREKASPDLKILGYDRVSLGSLLGWGGRGSRGAGMHGLPGFVLHQGITFLYTEYIPRTCQKSSLTNAQAVDLGRKNGSYQSDPFEENSLLKSMPRERERWITYRYFSREFDDQKPTCGDRTLGGFIEQLSAQSPKDIKLEKLQSEKCKIVHRSTWIHGVVQISAEVYEGREIEDRAMWEADPEAILMWESCKVCKKTTDRKFMADGSYLFSFGKFLELLIYSPFISALSPPLCEHTSPPSSPRFLTHSLSQRRFNIARHFISGRRSNNEVILRISQAPALFELRIPGLQFTRGRLIENDVQRTLTMNHTGSPNSKLPELDEDKKALRREIKQWWRSVSDYLDRLDEHFSDGVMSVKSLPHLPSYDDSAIEDGLTTPKAILNEFPSSRTSSFLPQNSIQNGGNGDGMTPMASRFASSSTNTMSQSFSPSDLLNNLRQCFQHAEQLLYAQLLQTPTTNLNDVRRSFFIASKGAGLRLSAWEKKHINESERNDTEGKFYAIEPEWWKTGCHAVPGSKVIVRECEWGSLIAFTLSSLDYQHEVCRMSSTKAGTTEKRQGTSTPCYSSTSNSYAPTLPSATSSVTSSNSESSSAVRSLDPDTESGIWFKAEPYSTSIDRQDHPQDPSGIFSLRDVLRQKRPVDTSASVFSVASKFTPSKFVSIVSGISPAPHVANLGTPPSAWAHPAVEVSMDAVNGKVSGLPEASESAEKVLQNLEASSETGSILQSWRMLPGSPDLNKRQRQRPPSLVSLESNCTEPAVDVPAPAHGDSITSSELTEATRSQKISPTSSKKATQEPSSTTVVTDPSGNYTQQHQQSATSTSTTSSLASMVTNTMRFFLNQAESQRPTSPVHHHKLLALDTHFIEDQPHIKYEWTIGTRLRFSCIVYYAKQFEYLRRRCGVDEIFPTSLERSENWAAEGGKSRSNFWKTKDDRFVIKTLVNAWNVADLQVLIELAPFYFRYTESTASRPSVIAKLLGFYTIEIKNLESGSVQAKADLLVMENVFFEQNISKTFDLKGIQGRKAKASGSSLEKTLHDGDWIEDREKNPILVNPASKLVLHEAVKADADFLCRNNIMDYSLLLGIDEGRRQIACGLVDMIGSYTFAKTLEYKAKQNLKSGKDVTVIPPNEYHDRFVAAMNNYFLACPDKWSRSSFYSSNDRLDSDLTLPSVL